MYSEIKLKIQINRTRGGQFLAFLIKTNMINVYVVHVIWLFTFNKCLFTFWKLLLNLRSWVKLIWYVYCVYLFTVWYVTCNFNLILAGGNICIDCMYK